MVLGTGTARLMCSMPSLSMLVRSSVAGAWAGARQIDVAGKTKSDARVSLLVIRLFISHFRVRRLSIKIRVKANLQLSILVGCGRRYMHVQHRHALLLVDVGEVVDGVFRHQD